MTKKKDKTQVERSYDAALLLFDMLTVGRRDCICAHSVTNKPSTVVSEFEKISPAARIYTGKPFWDYYSNVEGGPQWQDSPWAAKDVDAVFYILAYNEPYLCQLERFEHELHEKSKTQPHVPYPAAAMYQPFKLNGIALEGSSVMILDPNLYPRFSFYRDITWKGTAVVRCPISSLAKSLCPDNLTPEEPAEGSYRVKERLADLREPDALGKAIGMGYVASVCECRLNAD